MNKNAVAWLLTGLLSAKSVTKTCLKQQTIARQSPRDSESSLKTTLTSIPVVISSV